VQIIAGQNTAGLHGFRAQFETGAIDLAQPSVIKVGGPSAMLEIAALAKAFGGRDGPGLGRYPDLSVLRRHQVAELAVIRRDRQTATHRTEDGCAKVLAQNWPLP
jgi:L-alanine-DL-glutamate epimerase-like enolase superfamily enzyme